MGHVNERKGSGRDSLKRPAERRRSPTEIANQGPAPRLTLVVPPEKLRNPGFRAVRPEASSFGVTAVRAGVLEAGDSKLVGEGTWNRARQAGLGQPVSAAGISGGWSGGAAGGAWPSREGLWAAGEWAGVRRGTFEGSSPFFPGSGAPGSGNVADFDDPLTSCNSHICQKVSEVGIPH